ncbi:hypothetical protein [Acinetobacter venetianus]|uniref:hypothetical protein n=1 Tax=Acinetobacter venetianus TaxID=52133 RepID=UPI003F8EC661
MAQGLVLGQFFTLFFFFTHNIAARLALGQRFALLKLATRSIVTRLARQAKLCFVNSRHL